MIARCRLHVVAMARSVLSGDSASGRCLLSREGRWPALALPRLPPPGFPKTSSEGGICELDEVLRGLPTKRLQLRYPSRKTLDYLGFVQPNVRCLHHPKLESPATNSRKPFLPSP